MQEVLAPLKSALAQALQGLGVSELPEIAIQETPPGKEGDYGSPVAFALARTLRKAPPVIALEIARKLEPPPFVRRAFAVGGYLNFELDPAFLGQAATQPPGPCRPSRARCWSSTPP